MNKIDKAVKVALEQCLAVKKSETVLVVTDEGNLESGQVFYRAARPLCRDAVLMIMPERGNNGQEPPEQVAAAMLKSDAVFLATTKSLSHTRARKNASKAGARIASMPGITLDMMTRTLDVDYRRMESEGRRLCSILNGAREVNIKTTLGTDLTFSVKGRRAEPDTGIIPGPGGFTNLPAGEVYLAPVEGTAQGRLVVDGSIGDTGILKKPIEIAISRGFAVGMKGGREAKKLWEMLSKHGKNAFNVAEFGIGINPRAKITGNILEDEKALTTIHIALGDNSGFGGKVSVPSHQDGIVRDPSVWVDGKLLMEKGKLKI
ncbi:MAG: aminopeptidase [Candidatus Edwardsbacteria bacterium]|nr:aminopeptidase [Candidatus Edwardsbacteria bacterium]